MKASDDTRDPILRSERWPPTYNYKKPPKEAPRGYKPGWKKQSRVLYAILRTGFDVQTKIILIAYMSYLSESRKDWAVWPSEREIAAFTSLARSTVVDRKHRLIDAKVLLPCDPHEDQRKGFIGPPSATFVIDIRRLEALAFAVMDARQNAKVSRRARSAGRMPATDNATADVA
jgi:hypothetical protein